MHIWLLETLMMEALGSYETLVTIYQSTWRLTSQKTLCCPLLEETVRETGWKYGLVPKDVIYWHPAASRYFPAIYITPFSSKTNTTHPPTGSRTPACSSFSRLLRFQIVRKILLDFRWQGFSPLRRTTETQKTCREMSMSWVTLEPPPDLSVPAREWQDMTKPSGHCDRRKLKHQNSKQCNLKYQGY